MSSIRPPAEEGALVLSLLAAAQRVEELAAYDDWSSGSESDPEDQAVRAAKRRGGKKGAANQPLEAKQLGAANVPLEAKRLGGKLGSKNQPLEAKRLGGKRSGATRRAKAAAAKVAAVVAELEAERLEDASQHA